MDACFNDGVFKGKKVCMNKYLCQCCSVATNLLAKRLEARTANKS